MNRLFWKIFGWFWLALVLISLSVGWGVKLYTETIGNNLQDKFPQAQVATLTLAIEQGGKHHAMKFLRELSFEARHPVFVVDELGHDLLGRPLPRRLTHFLQDPDNAEKTEILATAVAPDGTHYQVIAPKKPWRRHQAYPRAALHWVGILIALILSTAVCFWLARYLSRPVENLQAASRKLAAGDLTARANGLDGRRDEIADLALDFNHMAEHIQQLLGAQKQLIRDISHELRSPLARLQVALALARRRAGERPAPELDRIERDIQRLDELIGQVLTLSRLESSQSLVLKDQIDIEEQLGAIVDDVRFEAQEKPCQIEIHVEPPLSPFTGNAELIHRALENVLRNALHYTAKNSTITITLQQAGDQLSISVCDRGPGVPESALNSLFEPFVRTDEARERRTGGYGLGLAIARRAAQVHGGTISAHNRSNGHGLCVILKLPLIEWQPL